MQVRSKFKSTEWAFIILCFSPLIPAFSFRKQNLTSPVLVEQRKSNLEMLLLLHNAKFKSDFETLKERGVIPVTHEEEDPYPLPVPDLISSTTVEPPSSTTKTIDLMSNSSNPMSTNMTIDSKKSSTSLEGDISVKEDKPRPMTNWPWPFSHSKIKACNCASIKDAYFDLLKEFKEFRTSVSQKISTLEHKLDAQKPHSDIGSQMDAMTRRIGDIYDKMIDIDLRHNLTELIDICVNNIMALEIMDAISVFARIDMNVPNPVNLETSSILKEIVSSAYIKNKSNSNPVFIFLRKLQNVDKFPAYEYLLNRMISQKNQFDGSNIFHIAEYLKEHGDANNAVRSSLYSRIPKVVQQAVSGTSVNIIYVDEDRKASRNYLHVNDGNRVRGDRENVYIRASQSYKDGRSAVWKIIYYPTSETFRIRNVLFNDYMFVNDENFVEITSMSNANQLGTEFDLMLENNYVVIKSKSYGQPLVSTWTGGRFPYIFSLNQNPLEFQKPARFIIEADTLL